MAKKLAGTFKLQLNAGEATMAPPVGPAFGQRGLNGMEFVKQFNAKTAKQKGTILPVLVTFFTDKSFTFIVKSPPASILLLQAAGIKKGSAESNKTKVGNVTVKQCEEIAKIKMEDLNCDTVESGIEMVKGTARSVGIVVEG
ncbi:MAG: 50S ribosomal protein L11 [Ignavibacteria bacterium GWB2_35_12]|nr:MAG: 50S ribosomal protein L11 [Ignavibacteria bacterium GWA2_35_8]OGU38288.1 MAG: 50S ribosomal protein L11 [Ignavibacteria bacterium GWB2_35_12]OGU95244.1 MAG: 50S ribosomal protein L11 [Ignavibacteria bacterium RIFOXYA2_FULL_35_10]OGV20774.1 MAG: 50S ribosomal protein L11 [Ignavibacteria bacterium RIFOXYC2_FULL_35_21]